MLIKPQGTNGNADQKKIKEIVVKNNLQVNKVNVNATGTTYIHCPSETVRDTLRQKLQENSEMTGHDIEPLQDMLPSITIVGVTVDEWEIT